MLREAGKRCGRSVLVNVLDTHVAVMGSVVLSYPTEHLDDEHRTYYRELRRAATRHR